MVLIVSTIREKMKFIYSMYKESMNHYEKLNDNDPLKADLKKYVTDLMAQSTIAINQFDYALVRDDDDDDSAGDSAQEELPL
jgi:hypothetical protein